MPENPIRRAIVNSAVGVVGSAEIDRVRAYMPANYHVIDRGADKAPMIEGYDHAGWTLDGYVLPRLASGLIFAEEIPPEEGMQTHADWLPQTEGEREYLGLLEAAKEARERGDTEAQCEIIREYAKPMIRRPDNPDGTIEPVRAQCLAIGVKEGWQ